MKRSTKIRRNKKSLANLELAMSLTCVRARRIAGVKLLSSLTSLSSLQKLTQTEKSAALYKNIQDLLAYERN